jgi:hypothetical protein
LKGQQVIGHLNHIITPGVLVFVERHQVQKLIATRIIAIQFHYWDHQLIRYQLQKDLSRILNPLNVLKGKISAFSFFLFI